MDLLNCPGIIYGGGEPFFLPPWIKVRVSRSQAVEVKSPKRGNRAVITSVVTNQATRISLTLSALHDTPSEEAILELLEEIWAHFSGPDKTFVFFEVNDRAWPECALETFDYEHDTSAFQFLQDAGIQIVSAYSAPDTNLQVSFNDYATEYPYASKVGRPVGQAATPGAPRSLRQSTMILPGNFFGVQSAATAAGQEHCFTIGGVTGTSWKLEGIQVTHADALGATGTTTVRVATYPVGGVPGSQIDATVGSAAFHGNEATGSITVTTGSTIYVYIPAGGAGGHQNIQYRVRLRAL